MKRISMFLVVVMVCGLLFTGCGGKKGTTSGSKEPKVGGTYVVSIGGDPQGFNPCANPDDNAYGIFQNVFNRLVKLTGDNDISPDLAKEWKYSEDGKTLTFYLNENVKWHDGQEFSSEDVKWTFDKIIKDKGFASAFFSDIEEVTCPDKNTVELKLKAPNAGLLGYIAGMEHL